MFNDNTKSNASLNDKKSTASSPLTSPRFNNFTNDEPFSTVAGRLAYSDAIKNINSNSNSISNISNCEAVSKLFDEDCLDNFVDLRHDSVSPPPPAPEVVSTIFSKCFYLLLRTQLLL